ncbi:MAG TPA: SPASM domain-containing protein, partial [Bacilli bacterium]|nr:SPASM domain-containing protein [Bacilli bacterium]
YDALATLDYAIKKLNKAHVIPFNISLHGGEVTTLSKSDFRNIIKYISEYYQKNRDLLTAAGFKVGSPHIKTNLYNLEQQIDTIKEFNVSISGSLDLPLKLHEEYRVTKGNQKTLHKILNNIALLKDLPNKKKVSATIFKEHFKHLEDIIKDINYLHKKTCLDMNDFNFMIGFDYNANGLLHHLTETEQLIFYKRMHQAFDGTELDSGVNGPWFDEFGPDYCTNCNNCGEKFFLLERNGDIYSCVRGQKQPDYFYGNIYQQTVAEILNTARTKIYINHNKLPLNGECTKCGYLYLCKTGCPFVKNNYQTNKSYTCLLQQQMYQDRKLNKDQYNEESVYQYVNAMRAEDSSKYQPLKTTTEYPPLTDIINNDIQLKDIFTNTNFIIKVDNKEYKLASQITKKTRDFIYLTPKSRIKIYMKKNLITKNCDYPQNNSLFMMLLSGDLITYGDENRLKQRHIANQQIYTGVLEKMESDKPNYYLLDITNFINEYKTEYLNNKPNNLFFTTSALRDYHYFKQKENAYYHIQAINLPFPNIEFYYLDKEFEK